MEQAEQQLNESVSLLRQAGQQNHLPLGLLVRAALRRVQERFTTENVILPKPSPSPSVARC